MGGGSWQSSVPREQDSQGTSGCAIVAVLGTARSGAGLPRDACPRLVSPPALPARWSLLRVVPSTDVGRSPQAPMLPTTTVTRFGVCLRCLGGRKAGAGGWAWQTSASPDVPAGLGEICLLVLTGPAVVGGCACCSAEPVTRSIPGAGGTRGCPCGTAFQNSPLNI